MTGRYKEAGFTLVEMLIAIFIFSLISVGTMTALSGSLQAKAVTKERLDEMADIQTARALMISDFANLVLVPTRDAYGTPEPYLLSGGVDTLISFTRSGRANPGGLEPRGDLMRLSYVLEEGNFIRRALAHNNPVPQTPSVERILFENVASASLEFVSDDIALMQLLVPAEGDVPPLDHIELTLRFENGDELRQLFEVSL